MQISDENVHHVRELMDEVFGPENFCGMIQFRKTSGANSPVARVDVVASVADYVLWYARDRERLKYRQLYVGKEVGGEGAGQYTWIEYPGGSARPLTRDERDDIPDVTARGGRLAEARYAVVNGL